MLTADAECAFRTDNHAWLSAWKNESIFQAGPSKAINWYRKRGTGSQTAAGLRASDADSMCGIAIMYDTINGKTFTGGESPSYQDSDATSKAHLVAIENPDVVRTVETLKPITYKRAFANCVALPD